jgi:hydrogenase maturation protease
MKAPVAVFAVGNRSRGDDSVAPLLLDRLRSWLDSEGLAQGFELIEEYQLQVEDALDLDGRNLVLFIDAARNAPREVMLEEVGARAGRANSHALEPAAVLDVCRQVVGKMPTAFVMKVHATCFDLGAGLSTGAAAAMEEAWILLRGLVRHPYPAAWRAAAAVRESRIESHIEAGGWRKGGEQHENSAIHREDPSAKGSRKEGRSGSTGQG